MLGNESRWRGLESHDVSGDQKRLHRAGRKGSLQETGQGRRSEEQRGVGCVGGREEYRQAARRWWPGRQAPAGHGKPALHVREGLAEEVGL